MYFVYVFFGGRHYGKPFKDSFHWDFSSSAPFPVGLRLTFDGMSKGMADGRRFHPTGAEQYSRLGRLLAIPTQISWGLATVQPVFCLLTWCEMRIRNREACAKFFPPCSEEGIWLDQKNLLPFPLFFFFWIFFLISFRCIPFIMQIEREWERGRERGQERRQEREGERACEPFVTPVDSKCGEGS